LKGADHDHQDHDHLVVQAQALSFPIHPPGRLRASADIPWDFRFIGFRSYARFKSLFSASFARGIVTEIEDALVQSFRWSRAKPSLVPSL
jgi:hypothetical protein